VNRPLLLFAPGAGAPTSHPWMQMWAARLEALGRVQLFDYEYQTEGRPRPDRLPALITTHRRALTEARRAEEPVIVIGKSMGGRIGCHVSLEEKVSGLVCFGYPLCGAGDPARLRDKVLRELTTPVLFIQGTRDSLCPLDLLEVVRKQMRAPNSMHLVEGGDHSLLVSKRQLAERGETQLDVDERIARAIEEFVAGVVSIAGLPNRPENFPRQPRGTFPIVPL
jgi:predicted alpha/beta-hydrolase family hydrolase